MEAHELDLRRLHDLGDDGQARSLARLGQEPQPVHAQALERVGAGSRLEGPASQHRRAGLGDGLGSAQQLVARLDRARAGHDRQRAAPDAGAGHLHDRVRGVELA